MSTSRRNRSVVSRITATVTLTVALAAGLLGSTVSGASAATSTTSVSSKTVSAGTFKTTRAVKASRASRAPKATAKQTPPPYSAPTSIFYSHNRCAKTGAGEWTITFYFGARGGNYSHMGNPNSMHKPVDVRGGGRTFTGVTITSGMGGPATAPPEQGTPHYAAVVSQIGKGHDSRYWKSLDAMQSRTVPVSCPA